MDWDDWWPNNIIGDQIKWVKNWCEPRDHVVMQPTRKDTNFPEIQVNQVW